MNKHQHRTALVTGSAKGIGLATTLQLLEDGKAVVMVDRNPVDIHDIIPAQFHSKVYVGTADITDIDTLKKVIQQSQAQLGPITILVNNAGISPKHEGRSAGLFDVSDEEWEQVMRINVKAALDLCKLCVPTMVKEKFGRIVNVSSLAGRSRSRVSGISYMTSKSAILGMSRAIANEMAPHGITTNCVAPGRILTEMAMAAGPKVNQSYAQAIPVQRLGTPEEVAAAIAFLCSDLAGFINGAVLDVNGGFFMS